MEVTIWMRNVPTIESPIKFPPGVHLMTPVSTCCVCTLHFLCDLLTLSTHQQELVHHTYITVCSVQSISLACACNKLHEISGERVYCVIVHVYMWVKVCPEKHFFFNSHICTHSNYFLDISFVYKRFRTH